MRSLIDMIWLVSEVLSCSHDLVPRKNFFVATKSQVFEDNAHALQLAKTKKMMSRTRHMACKYFWFIERVNGESIDIVKIDRSI
jgi:hypothetical protein